MEVLVPMTKEYLANAEDVLEARNMTIKASLSPDIESAKDEPVPILTVEGMRYVFSQLSLSGNEFDSQGRRMNLEGDFSAYQNAATLVGEVPVGILESAASVLAIDPSKMGKHEIPDNWRDNRAREHGSLLSVPQSLIEGTGVELETYGRVGVFESVMLMRLGLQGSLDKRIRDTEQSKDASVRIKR